MSDQQLITMDLFCGAIQEACVPHAPGVELGARHEAVWSMNDVLVRDAGITQVQVPRTLRELFEILRSKMGRQMFSLPDEQTLRQGLTALEVLLTELPDFANIKPHVVRR